MSTQRQINDQSVTAVAKVDMNHQERPKFEDTSVPRHIAIIMDGNGRWAQQRSQPRVVGHQAGVEAARRTVEACVEWGVGFLTLYTFSTENWNRPQQEVDFLMSLIEQYVSGKDLNDLVRHNVQLNILGQQADLPPTVKQTIQHAMQVTAGNTGLRLNLALNYGGRSEIVDATRAVLRRVQEAKLDPHMLDEATLDQHLYTAGMPDLDLIIRTSGEIRLSNFMLWQAVDAYFWVTDTFWPDFERDALQAAISSWRVSALRGEAL